MYNHQLDTFICVADAGSFSKAAEGLYISSTAVMKQINQLEKSLDVQLFIRTPRGLKLTDAGKSYYQDAKYMIRYAREARTRAQNAMKDNDNIIRIGTSLMTPHQFLIDLWPQIHALWPELKFQIINFENTPENAREILTHLGKDIDVVAGIFDDTMLGAYGTSAIELNRQPLCCAVSIFHPLAQKDRLEIDDLNGQNLMVIERNWMREIDILREDLEKNHPLIHLKNFSFYNVDIFNECENNDAILIAVPLWQSVHPLLKIIPVNWNHSTSFGLFHNPNPSSTVRKFLDTIAQIKYS